MLIVVSGLPGTGKSALADDVGRSLGATVLSVDPIEAALLESGIEQSFATGFAAYRVAATVAEANLALGQTIIVDAVNSVAEAKAWWPMLAERAGVELAVIECVCSDVQLHRSRLEGRDRGLAFPEPSWADVERRREEWVPWSIEHSSSSGRTARCQRRSCARLGRSGRWRERRTTKRPKEPRSVASNPNASTRVVTFGSWPLQARPTLARPCRPWLPGYPRVSEFVGRSRAHCPQASHESV